MADTLLVLGPATIVIMDTLHQEEHILDLVQILDLGTIIAV